ncbi:unnamed protein product [Nesidiocoris tenuis]|uniref:Uncharacterized protein n=1 Tax=Nesidiocoris tenuis TaxID=355587 RepID=A0A6H5HV54_9HEMI|nr:unnamed protein product [Nesidiocoris tenuis]
MPRCYMVKKACNKYQGLKEEPETVDEDIREEPLPYDYRAILENSCPPRPRGRTALNNRTTTSHKRTGAAVRVFLTLPSIDTRPKLSNDNYLLHYVRSIEPLMTYQQAFKAAICRNVLPITPFLSESVLDIGCSFAFVIPQHPITMLPRAAKFRTNFLTERYFWQSVAQRALVGFNRYDRYFNDFHIPRERDVFMEGGATPTI